MVFQLLFSYHEQNFLSDNQIIRFIVIPGTIIEVSILNRISIEIVSSKTLYSPKGNVLVLSQRVHIFFSSYSCHTVNLSRNYNLELLIARFFCEKLQWMGWAD